MKKINKKKIGNNKLIALSLETTSSTDNVNNSIDGDYHKIISLSAYKVEQDEEDEVKHINILPVENYSKNYFHSLYNNDKKKIVTKIPELIFKINGLNNDILKDEKPFFSYAKNLFQFLKNNPEQVPTYLLSFSPYNFDIHVLKNEMDYAKLNNHHITNEIYDSKTFRKDIRYIDIRNIYLHYESDTNSVKHIDDLFDLYFPAEETVIFKQIRLSDKIDILKEKQKEIYNIKTDAQYFDYALLKKDNFTIDRLPVLVHYYFNGSSLKDIYKFYTGNDYNQPKDNVNYKNECYLEIFFEQLKKYKIDLEMAYKISTNKMVDWDKQLLLDDDNKVILNFGKYKNKTVDYIIKTDSDYIFNYMLKQNNKTGLFRFKRDTRNLLQRYLNKLNKIHG